MRTLITLLFISFLALGMFVSACRKVESPTLPGDPSSKGCPFASVPVAINPAGVSFNGDTTGETDKLGDASCQGGADAPDDLYRFTLTDTAVVRVSTNAAWSLRAYLRRDSCEGVEVACYSSNGDHDKSLSAGTYYLVIDGDHAAAKGTYQLTLRDVTL